MKQSRLDRLYNIPECSASIQKLTAEALKKIPLYACLNDRVFSVKLRV